LWKQQLLKKDFKSVQTVDGVEKNMLQ